MEVAYFPSSPTSNSIIDVIREFFQRFGVPEELALDGGPNIMSREIKAFLYKWGTTIRQSSAYYPKSNGRAEAAVKTMKRIVDGNTGSKGSLKTDEIAKALLQYRNTPLKTGKKSPAQLLLGRSLRDSIPQPASSYQVASHWQQYLRHREVAYNDATAKVKAYHDASPTKQYDEISIGTHVICQNMHNKRWDRTGVIMDIPKHRQYIIKMDGSGRLSLRNRIHIRPVLSMKPHMVNLGNDNTTLPHSSSSGTSSHPSTESLTDPTTTSNNNSEVSTELETVPLRRSGRNIRQPDRYGEWVSR